MINKIFKSKNKNIAVVGDFIIDEYYFVEANKISPEFPIPIMLSKCNIPEKILPGGAGNVCRQLSNLGLSVDYFGIADQYSLKLTNESKFKFNGAFYPLARIPIKKRYYQKDFPLCRLDVETSKYDLSCSDLELLQNKICNNLVRNNSKVVIFSDYNKGVFLDFDIKKYFNSLDENTIKIVDPKYGPASKWKGCNVIKPNSKEALALSGENDWKKQLEFFRKETQAECILITQEGDGVVGLIDEEFIEIRPEKKISASCVIGAGDCFISIFSLCLLSEFSYLDSANFAFRASSLYVQKKYCDPIDLLDLLEIKKVDYPELLSKRNFSLAFTNGCFDILHPGHIGSLEFAKSKADKLVVGLNSDSSAISQNKSHPLINKIETRIKMLESLNCVDYIVVFDEKDPFDIINKIKPDVLVKSTEYKNPIGSDLVEKVEFFPVMEEFSTSKIIKKIKDFQS
jgi:D-beta-D-heptose 7-phosphate kinase/D-beta-D-heptose 1-phosphate adenosyltransferase